MTKAHHDHKLHPDKKEMLTFAVDQILDNSITDFDLYLDVPGGLVLYAKPSYRWTKDELARLLADGHQVLYYSTADRHRAEAYMLVHQTPKVDWSSPPSERIQGLTDAAAELNRILYHHPLTAVSLDKVRHLATSMVDCVEEDRTCIAALGKLAHHDYYTFYHSARVSAYALAIAMELSQKDRIQLVEMATGALLHDIGKSRVDLGILNKAGALTPDEWSVMRQHPLYGDEVVAEATISYVSRQIILSHHERFDGSGYPHNLSERELLEEVKVVAFADTFDALTTNRPYQVSRTPFEALDLIRHKLLKNMHKDSYQALVTILAAAGRPEVA